MDRDDLLTWQGLMALSDAPMPVVENVVTFPRIRQGSILFTAKAWRAPWRGQWLKLIKHPCVLVTAFHDRCIRPHPMGEMFQTPIRHWFGVQCATVHPQLTAMPIGIDGRKLAAVQAAERRSTRDVLLYCNFALINRWPESIRERQSLWATFSGQSWVTSERNVPPAQHAAMLGRSKFVLSPRGNGWDCYRTYEAIALGAIPIVKRHPPVSDVCNDLPVLMVDDWNDVTPERLNREWDNRQAKDTRTMTMSYWRERITAKARELS